MEPQNSQNQPFQLPNIPISPSRSDSPGGILTKKNIIMALGIGVLLLSIPFAVSMLQQRQELRSRASSDVIKFSGPGVECKGDECTTSSTTVQIELRAPAPTSSDE